MSRQGLDILLTYFFYCAILIINLKNNSMKNILIFALVIMMTITTVGAQDYDYKKDSLLQQQQRQNYLDYLSSKEDTLVPVMIHVIDTIDKPEFGRYLVRESDGSYDTINPLYSSQYVHSFPGRMRDNRDVGGRIEYFYLSGEPVKLLEGQIIKFEPYKKSIPREEYLKK